MHHGDPILKMCEGLIVEPLDQLHTIGCVENVLEIVLPTGLTGAARNRHQMKVMITQDEGYVVAVGIEPSQGTDVVGPAIDQIAHTPEPVFVGIKPDLCEEVLEGLKTALNVADNVGAHSDNVSR